MQRPPVLSRRQRDIRCLGGRHGPFPGDQGEGTQGGIEAFGAIQQFEEAFYFSMVTYTTLGYGDVTLEPPFRVLSSFEAAAGVIMFGWTTALIVAAVQHVYFPRQHSIPE